jgi:MFS family permease
MNRTHSSDPRSERHRIWWAQFLCAVGQGMGTVLIAMTLLAGSHGPGSIGLCVAAGLLPVAIGAGRAGRLAERRSRRGTLVVSQLALAAVAAALAVESEPRLALVAVAAFGWGIARLAFDASCLSSLHHLVAEDRLGTAARDLTGQFHAGYVCGLGLAAAGAAPFGPQALFLVAAAIFGAGAVVSASHHADIDLRPQARQPLHHAVAHTSRLLWGERPLRVLTMAGLLASVIAGGAGALILPYLRLDLGLGPAVQPVFLVGIVVLGITTIVAPRVIGFVPWKSALVCALAAQPLALVILALADGARQAAVGYGALLGASALVGLVVNSRRAGHVHGELRVPIGLAGGAVNARAGALGALLVGMAAIPLGEARAYLLLAVISIVAGAAALLLARPAAVTA